MKATFLFVFIPFLAFTAGGSDLTCMLTNAVALHDKEYLAARQKILDMGHNALPLLAQAAADKNYDWRTHLVARICYERIIREKDIKELRNHNWRAYPPYQPGYEHEKSIVSAELAAGDMSKYIIPKCTECGLWYYYAEVMWKETKEFPEIKTGQMFNEHWMWSCMAALKCAPEGWYYNQILSDYFETAGFDNRINQNFYAQLIEKRNADFVPILLRRYDDYFARTVGNTVNMYPGQNAEIYQKRLASILSFSDSRHAAQIEKFIAARPALASLTNKLAEVRARPAPLTQPPEPPFRLGTNVVNVVTP